jgi:ElaB/YqjD/DUF883 family membrane-anchored ribosome-binding protein
MVDVDAELDLALSRLVDAEDEIDRLKAENAELSDALEAMLKARSATDADTLAELGSLRRRNADLEAALDSRRRA